MPDITDASRKWVKNDYGLKYINKICSISIYYLLFFKLTLLILILKLFNFLILKNDMITKRIINYYLITYNQNIFCVIFNFYIENII